jgi:hypothetical protein
MFSRIEKMKSILVCVLFYQVALDTSSPLPKTKLSNKYVLVAIDHYFKWCETKFVKNHIVTIAVIFLEEKIICRFGVPKYVLTNSGGEWIAKFDTMCNCFGITHQFTTPQCPYCNGMVERMIKTLNHGLIVIFVGNI